MQFGVLRNFYAVSSVRTIPWALGEPTFFFIYIYIYIYIYNGGGGSCAYNDLQRYITATSVCTTCTI